MAVSCGNCGAEVDIDWRFCRSCGAEVEEAGSEVEVEDTGSRVAVPATNETDAPAQRDPNADTPGADALTEEEARARRKVSTALLVGIAVLVALVGAGMLVLELLGR